MANQTIHTQGSVADSFLKAGKAGEVGKSDAKNGVFAKLVASFQKHIKQGETHSPIDGQKVSSKEKSALNGLQTGLFKVNPEGVEKVSKAKSSLKVIQADKTSEGVKGQALKGETAKAETALSKTVLSIKSLQHNSNAQVLAKKNSEQQDVLNTEVTVADEADKSDTEKLQKHAAIGLGIFQQESREPVAKVVGDSGSKEEIFVGLEGKKNKNTESGEKSPRLVMNNKDSAEQKGLLAGQNKTERIVGEALVAESKSVDIAPAKEAAQGRFSLNNTDTIDDGVDVSKLIKRDEVVSVKNQSKGEDISAKTASLASVGNTSDDMKGMPQNEGNKRQDLNANLLQGKQVKGSPVQQGLGSEEGVSKTKIPFKVVTANRSGIAGIQAQASMSVASNVQSDAIIKLSGGQDANMTGDDRGIGRSAAELLMVDGSTRDVRSTRSDFAMQMAYRSAASFKPSDAMLEISKAAKDGSIKLELMLEPATLGKIQVSLQTDAQKQIQVHLIVDQQSSRQVLEQQLPQLRQALADQGLNLSGFTMDMNSQQQNDGKASHGVAGMGDLDVNSESENGISLGGSLRMGVNMADDGSLSILA
ncbi:flagellar hook-length control protein FliK [Mariprofundus ferrooxydans]|nr:flagellar hook-length control protein FliK [Mariprofundus ferrooxydans]